MPLHCTESAPVLFVSEAPDRKVAQDGGRGGCGEVGCGRHHSGGWGSLESLKGSQQAAGRSVQCLTVGDSGSTGSNAVDVPQQLQQPSPAGPPRRNVWRVKMRGHCT